MKILCIDQSHIFRLKFANNKTLTPPQWALSRKANFIGWQSSKLGLSEPAPTRAPCLGWIACGIDNSLVYTSVAPSFKKNGSPYGSESRRHFQILKLISFGVRLNFLDEQFQVEQVQPSTKHVPGSIDCRFKLKDGDGYQVRLKAACMIQDQNWILVRICLEKCKHIHRNWVLVH